MKRLFIIIVIIIIYDKWEDKIHKNCINLKDQRVLLIFLDDHLLTHYYIKRKITKIKWVTNFLKDFTIHNSEIFPVSF